MRIVHITDYFQPALGYQEFFLARQLGRLGHKVEVITGNRTIGSPWNENRVFKNENTGRCELEPGLRVTRLPVCFVLAGRVWLSGLETKIRELDPDVIHTHGTIKWSTLRLIASKRFAKAMCVRLVVDDHMYPSISKNQLRRLYPFVSPYGKLVQQIADSIVAVSHTTKRFMIENYGICPERISVIPLAADCTRFHFDPAARKEVRQELNIPADGFVIICTGKLTANKDIHVLANAFASLAMECDNGYLVLIGFYDEEYQHFIKRCVGRERVLSRMKWLAGVHNERLYRYFSAADVAVYPAHHTISVLEAMACRLPVVVSDNPRSAEEVRHGNGIVFPEGSVSALVGSLKSLIQDRNKARTMGYRGLEAVKEYYNWPAVTQEFLRLYDSRR